MADGRFVTYETLHEGRIARIWLNRPDARNAQNYGLLGELDEAFLRAEADEDVRVVILGGLGPAFSAGHDLGTPERLAENEAMRAATDRRGGEERWLREFRHYFENTRRWRDLRKITIAQVHGYCISAGLMLAWCCDLICASDDAVFVDVVGARLGMCGLEYFAHPWELGPRKAKELLLTGDSIDADEAYRLGMVNKVFARDALDDETLNLARRIAEVPSFAALLIKESVNQTQDAQGFYTALKACFSIHEANHAHWAEVTNGAAAIGTPEFGVSGERRPIQRAERTSSGLPA